MDTVYRGYIWWSLWTCNVGISRIASQGTIRRDYRTDSWPYYRRGQYNRSLRTARGAVGLSYGHVTQQSVGSLSL